VPLLVIVLSSAPSSASCAVSSSAKKNIGHGSAISRCNHRRMNLHYSTNGVEERRAQAHLSWKRAPLRGYNRYNRPGVGPRHRGPCVLSGSTSRDRARFATPRWSRARAPFSIPIIAPIARSRYGTARLGFARALVRTLSAFAWEHAFVRRAFDRLDAFLRAFPQIGISGRKLPPIGRSCFDFLDALLERRRTGGYGQFYVLVSRLRILK